MHPRHLAHNNRPAAGILLGYLLAAILVAGFCPAARALPAADIEEVIARPEPANNGAGPLWCYGSPLIVRDGERVFASVIETGKDVPPLCNTRWQLWKRDAAGWKVIAAEQQFRQREPCPIGLFPGGPVFLSVNPSTQPPGTHYGPCQPQVLQFEPGDDRVDVPAWAAGTHFTDHSYRGFAVDGSRRELLLLNINATTGDQFVSHRGRDGQWRARGTIHFPIRSCYPQVALAGGAAHVMAIGDIVEPVAEWRKLKKEVLKQDWDYVFRRLFYAWTPDISGGTFAEPIEIDNLDATAGAISNLDMLIDPDGACHLLYLRRPHQYEFMRDKYWPGEPMTWHLVHVVVREGRVVVRETLAETRPRGSGIEPHFARFHRVSDGTICVIVSGASMTDGSYGRLMNFVGRLTPGRQPHFEPIELKNPFTTFFTNTTRGGSPPSDTLDLFGISTDSPNLRYARVRLDGGGGKPSTAPAAR
jgi:hypothetical protein